MDAGHPSGLFGGSPSGSALIVHAGAWAIPTAERDAHMEGCRRAIDAGWRVLLGGGSALEAVVVAVGVMEDDPALNAGTGSVLCRQGWVEMDASVMDGRALEFGAVAAVRDVAHPVRLAREVMGSDARLLIGEGASAFARERGIDTIDPRRLVVARERARLSAWEARATDRAAARDAGVPADTVGAVARDADGHFAAASSSGGRVGKRSGRVGDTPLPGSGVHADDACGAAACTGWGERILRFGLARRATDLARDLPAQVVCGRVLQEMTDRVGGDAGLILLSKDGSIGFGFNTGSMAVAYMDGELPSPVVRV
jgi:beta-aspartyl-peptidase (threonine type)